MAYFFQGRLHLVGQRPALGGHLRPAVHLRENLGGLAQRRHGEEVRRHEEQEGRRIVRRTEHRSDQPHGIHRIAVADVAHRVELAVRDAQEGIGSHALLALLLAERPEDILHGREPVFVENRRIARPFPVFIGQADRITERVDLPLTLVNLGAHLRPVGLPVRVGIGIERIEEGVGIGIQPDILELAADDARDHAAQLLVLRSQLHVGPHLRPGVAEPHGMNVARIDHRVVPALLVLAGPAHRRIERIGEAVLEHPRQPGVGEHALDAGDFGLYGLGSEEPLGLGGPVRHGVFRRGGGQTRIIPLAQTFDWK